MTDREAERAEARRLRSEEGLSGRQIQQRLGVSKTLLQEWLRGVPPPAWTARPTAKDDRRARALACGRRAGRSTTTTRRNTGVEYNGCLVITVPRGRELYWRIEGMMSGMAIASGSHSASGSDRR
jgi:transcriptional regulator with XRE-family HTH domain